MRIQYRYVTFQKNKELIKTLEDLKVKYLFEEKDYGEGVESYFLEFNLYEDESNFEDRFKAVQKFDLFSHIGTEYEKRDYEIAEWFLISTRQYQYPQPEDNYLEKTFDSSNHCEHCGIGKIQNNPFRLKHLPKHKNSQFLGLHWEFEYLFIREEAKNILKKEKIKEIEFSNPVLHKKNIAIDNFYQLHVKKVLPKGLVNYNARLITCKLNNEEDSNVDKSLKYCKRIKYHHPMVGGYVFNKEIFDDEFDIALTAEYFGSGGSANRLTICSKRFKNIIESNKLRGLDFIPIIHEKYEKKLK